MVDKPGITTLEQLAEVRKVQAETKRIYSIMYSERLENRATVKAGELVQAGAIGRVVQTIGMGPHRINLKTRPAWFFERQRYGGILCDIGSHQADQFLFFTGSTSADVVASQVGNLNHPQYPGFDDFGDMMLRGNRGTGYVRVDWFTPNGLSTWGDGRLTILGTDGFIEIRKNVDITKRPEGNHLFLVDQKETRYIDCQKVELPYGEQLVQDILNRTETAMPQAHCFLATELVLKAQKQAQRVNFKSLTVRGVRPGSDQGQTPTSKEDGSMSGTAKKTSRRRFLATAVRASSPRRSSPAFRPSCPRPSWARPRRATASTSGPSAWGASRAGTTCRASGSTTRPGSWRCATSTASASTRRSSSSTANTPSRRVSPTTA